MSSQPESPLQHRLNKEIDETTDSLTVLKIIAKVLVRWYFTK